MEPVGRRRGDSFRSMSSYGQSCKRSCKKHLDSKTTKSHTAEKVRKQCKKLQKRESGNAVLIIIHPCFTHLLLPASVSSEWSIEHLWPWACFQFPEHRCFPSPGAQQEAQPQSDQCAFRCLRRERQNLRQAAQPQERFLRVLEFWKNTTHRPQVTSGCSSHHRHQSHDWKQPHQPRQCLLRRQHWGDGKECFCQPKLFLRSLGGSGAAFLTSWTGLIITFKLSSAGFFWIPNSLLSASIHVLCRHPELFISYVHACNSAA